MSELTTANNLTPALVNAIALWADARTDPASARRLDLLRDKRRAVSAFFAWVGKAPAEVAPLDVKGWQMELERQGLAHSTVYAMISRVSSFYTWLMADPDMAGQIRVNPVALARPKAPRAYQSESTKSLDDQEIRALLGVVKGKAGFDVVGKRDYALLLIFLATGLRRSEVIRLRWGDVKLNGNMIVTTRVKGGDRLTLEIDDPRVLDALLDYLKSSGRWGHLDDDDPLWTRHDRAGRPGATLTARSVAANLKRYARKCGMPEFHVHQLRHTAARLVADTSGDLTATQTFLGHRNANTTRIYVQRIGVRADKFSATILDQAGA